MTARPPPIRRELLVRTETEADRNSVRNVVARAFGQTDEAEMGFSYDMLEAYLLKGASAVPPKVAERIEKLRRNSDHKRALPPIGPT